MYRGNLEEWKTNYGSLEVRQLGSSEDLQLEEQRTQLMHNAQCIMHNYFKCKNYSLFIINYSLKKAAFTLAEVLITLGVIGVVAAVTIPVLMTNINDRVNFERHANIAYKMTQAMEQMRAHGKLVQYESTEKFVDELQKYLKIQKRCSASNISECWPTETVINGDGEEYNVSDAHKRKNLLPNATTGNTDDDNVGLILADGTSIILTYDNSKTPIDIGDRVTTRTLTNPKGQEIAYTIEPTTASIDFITDVNGERKPNREGKDIKSFSGATFSKWHHPCDEGPAGCIYKLPTFSSIDCSSANSSSDDYKNYCGNPSGYTNDKWAGANKACKQIGMTLPTKGQLETIYNNRSSYTGELSALSSETRQFWSSTESSDSVGAWVLSFNNGYADGAYKTSSGAALCLVE